ncbi:hypothetical protein RR48_11788 [Papilio machaon]|uniref:Chitin-binding type-2 domain-containing protein n=1 Tax=Papilio machaon TaxID=76193 RepID=A0A194QT74_PAPMA|nr:hypothetical protein RR48_11788 [Papilio machaon]
MSLFYHCFKLYDRVNTPFIKMFFFATFALLVALSNAVQEVPKGAVGDEVCKEYNTYYKIQGSCDSYVECNAYKATYKTCPDGLYFVRDVQWPTYPCAYPSDAQCEYNDQPRTYPSLPALI